MLTWHYLTQSMYNDLSTSEKTSDKLFFIKDTKEIYCGETKFLEPIVIYTNNEPATNISGKLYINAYTLEGRIWDGTSWIMVINPVRKMPCEHIDNDILSISYIDNELLVDLVYGTVDNIDLANFSIDILLDISTGDAIIENGFANLSNTNGIIDIGNFINSVSYKDNYLILLFDNTEMCLDISACINDTDEILLITITGNKFIAETVLVSNDNNIISNDKNIYIVTNMNKNNISTFSLISNETDVTTNSDLISSNALYEIRSTLVASVENKMNKVGYGYTGEILVANSEGDASPSGVKIGGEKLSTPYSNNVVATEKAIVDYITNNTLSKSNISTSESMPTNVDNASDNLIASEKSLLMIASMNVL